MAEGYRESREIDDRLARRYIMTTLGYLNEVQEHLDAAEDDRGLLAEVQQAKAILTTVLRKSPAPPEEFPAEAVIDLLNYGFSPAQRHLMTAMGWLSDAQEHLGTSEDDRALVDEVNQAKLIIAGVLEKIPPGWANLPFQGDDQDQENQR